MTVGEYMLGKIIGIEENVVLLRLNVKIEEMVNIINLYVVLEDKDKRLVHNRYKRKYSLHKFGRWIC